MSAVTVTQAAALIRKAKSTALEDLLLADLAKLGLPVPEREYRFHHIRRFRFDMAYPDHMLAVEVEGGQYIRGRHQRPAGFALDCTKYNLAALMGWTVLRFTGEMVKSGQAAREIAAALGVGE